MVVVDWWLWLCDSDCWVVRGEDQLALILIHEFVEMSKLCNVRTVCLF